MRDNNGKLRIFSNMRAGTIPSRGFTKFKDLPFGKICACIAITVFMALMLAKPEFYLDSARRGLSLYATSVLPSLFPFYFFSLLLTYIGSAKAVSTVFQKPVRLLYNAPKESAYVLLLSMMSGYPVGASMTSELYLAGAIDEKEAKAIASFASTSGPIFMLGTVGSAIFGDVRVGAVILASHYVSALLNGLIFKVRRKKQGREEIKTVTAQDVAILSQKDADNIMSRTIANSTLSMLYVGGYIVLCGMLVDTLSLVGLDGLIISSLGESAGRPVLALVEGLIEMTRGSIECVNCAPNVGIALCCATVSFGGLSVMLQNYTFLSKCKMSFFEILIRKTSQSVIAFIISFALSFTLARG